MEKYENIKPASRVGPYMVILSRQLNCHQAATFY